MMVHPMKVLAFTCAQELQHNGIIASCARKGQSAANRAGSGDGIAVQQKYRRCFTEWHNLILLCCSPQHQGGPGPGGHGSGGDALLHCRHHSHLAAARGRCPHCLHAQLLPHAPHRCDRLCWPFMLALSCSQQRDLRIGAHSEPKPSFRVRSTLDMAPEGSVVQLWPHTYGSTSAKRCVRQHLYQQRWLSDPKRLRIIWHH